MTTPTVSANRLKKRAKKQAAAAEDPSRLIQRIRNLFEYENWSTERIGEAVKLPRSEVIRLIQSSTLDK